MLRVLLINWRDIRNPEAGGAEVYYHEIFRRIAAAGVRVDVMSHRWSGAAGEEHIDGIRVIRRGSRSLFNYQILPYVRRHQNAYDLIIEDLNKLPFFTPLYVRRRRLHLVMHFFGVSIFHETNPLFAAYVYASERLIGLCYRGERFVAISDSTASEVRVRTRPAGEVAVVQPGVDTDFFRPTAQKSAVPLLVCVTRLMRYKNLQFVIAALPKLRGVAGDVRLAIAGRGPYEDALRRLARACGVLGQVEFLGRVSEEEKRDLLSRATLFINPSAKEGWGITSIEAACCGTATVASDVAGLRDSVLHGRTGMLYPLNDMRTFVATVTQLLGDEERRSEMQRQAASFAAGLSWDAVAGRMHLLLQRCAQ